MSDRERDSLLERARELAVSRPEYLTTRELRAAVARASGEPSDSLRSRALRTARRVLESFVPRSRELPTAPAPSVVPPTNALASEDAVPTLTQPATHSAASVEEEPIRTLTMVRVLLAQGLRDRAEALAVSLMGDARVGDEARRIVAELRAETGQTGAVAPDRHDTQERMVGETGTAEATAPVRTSADDALTIHWRPDGCTVDVVLGNSARRRIAALGTEPGARWVRLIALRSSGARAERVEKLARCEGDAFTHTFADVPRGTTIFVAVGVMSSERFVSVLHVRTTPPSASSTGRAFA